MAMAPGPQRRRRPVGPVSRPAGRHPLLGARLPAPRQRPHRAPGGPSARGAGLRRLAPGLVGRAWAARRLARACGGQRRPRERWGGCGRQPARASAPARPVAGPVAAAALEHPAGPPGHAHPGGQKPRGRRPHGRRTPRAPGRGQDATDRPASLAGGRRQGPGGLPATELARCRRGNKRPSGRGQRAGAWRPLRPAARERCRVPSRRTASRRSRPTPVGRGRSRVPRASWPDAHRPWGGGVAGSSPSQETPAACSACAPCATSRRLRLPHCSSRRP